MLTRVKKVVKKVPFALRTWLHLRVLWQIACDRRGGDPVRRNDESHLRKEWDFDAPVEQERYGRMLRAVERHLAGLENARVLEIGCSSGAFTARLGECGASVAACDISPVALELAARRCERLENVRFQRLDLQREPIRGVYDVVFVMDVFEFIHGRRLLQSTIRKVAAAVRPGGLLAVSSCRINPELRNACWVRWLVSGGDAIVRAVASEPALREIHRELHPPEGQQVEGYVDHVLAVFRRVEKGEDGA
jgi:2-polyprenyl-3-methyl-5-hydroxy-6-metoxy-1,4-benzoquinol methylase